MNKKTVWMIALILMVGLAGHLSIARSAEWQTAPAVHFAGQSAVMYGQLSLQGQAAVYQLAVSKPTLQRVEIGVPESTGTDFSPRLVLYRPDMETFGPPLPIEQPPNTLAEVYPTTGSVEAFDVFSQIAYRQELQAALNMSTPGTYYVALYNPSSTPGRYRLTIDHGKNDVVSWADAWRLPMTWWQDQSFAGWTWRTLLTPALLVVLIILVIEQLRFYHLHHLAPSRSPKRRARRKT